LVTVEATGRPLILGLLNCDEKRDMWQEVTGQWLQLRCGGGETSCCKDHCVLCSERSVLTTDATAQETDQINYCVTIQQMAARLRL
jgi:hypothetical protein